MENKLQNSNKICKPENFYTNISHQLFIYKMTFVHQKALIQLILYSKTGLKRSFRDFCYTKINLCQKYISYFHILYLL